MATSILKKVNAEKAAKNVRNTAKKINKEVMKTSEVIVDEALVAGENWTKVMAKAMKTGTALFGKQQDLVLDALEGIKGQTVTGTKRFGKLIGFASISKSVKNATKEAKAKVEETRQSIDEAYDKVVSIDIVKTVNETVDKVTTTAKETIADTRQAIEEVLDVDVKAKKTVAKKAVKKTAKKVTKQATAKKVATKKVAKVVADDLKTIEGIGPKMEIILNDAGIKTFKQLATTKVSTVKEILAAAGPRYNMHDPSNWGKQAKFAAAGRFAELKTLKAELKAAKVKK